MYRMEVTREFDRLGYGKVYVVIRTVFVCQMGQSGMKEVSLGVSECEQTLRLFNSVCSVKDIL